MSDSSEEIPTSGEDYQLFPRRLFQGDNSELADMSIASPSLPQGYRSLGQIISAAASMGVSAPSSRPAATTPGVSPQMPVTSVPVRPTICVAASSPVVTASAARAVPTPEDVYLATAILENISPEEYRLSLQQPNVEAGPSSQDPNRSYFLHYAQDGTPVYAFPGQYDKHGEILRLPASEAYLYAQGLPYNQVYDPQGQPFQGQPAGQPGYLYDP